MSALSFSLLMLACVLLIAVGVGLWLLYRQRHATKRLCLEMLNASQAMTWRWSIKEDSMVINPHWSRFLGFSLLDLQPFSYRKGLALLHPDEVSRVSQMLEGVLHGDGDDFDLEFRIRTKEEGYKWVRVSGQVSQRDNKGRPVQMIGLMQDINELTLSRRLLQYHALRDRCALALSRFAKRGDMALLCEKTLSSLVALNDGGVGAIYLSSPQENTLRLAAVFPIEEKLRWRKTLSREKFGLFREVRKGSQKMDSKNAAALLSDGQSFRRVLSVALEDADEACLLVVLDNSSSDSDPMQRQTVQLFAQQLSTALRLHRLQATSSQQTQQIERLAHFDALTALPNRNLVLDRIQQAIERQKRNRKDLALLLIDLENFALIKQHDGRDAADALLQTIAQRYITTLRKVDTVGRMGCAEFVVLIESYANSKDIMYIAKRLLEASCEPCLVEDREIKATASIGVFFYHQPELAMQPQALIDKAGIALSQAKQRGGAIAVYQPEMA